jgi:hypothetical protein
LIQTPEFRLTVRRNHMHMHTRSSRRRSKP